MLKYGFTIYGLEHFAPCEFYVTNQGNIFYHNQFLGFAKHPTIKTEEALAAHVFNMIKDGFSIETFSHDQLENIFVKYNKVFNNE